MNSSQAMPPLRLRNIGETPLTGIAVNVIDGDLTDESRATLNSAVRTSHPAHQNLNLPQRGDAAGALEPTSAFVHPKLTQLARSAEWRPLLSGLPHEAHGLPVVDPAIVRLGDQPGTSVDGVDEFQPRVRALVDTRVEVQDQASFNWVLVQEPVSDWRPGRRPGAFAIVLGAWKRLPLRSYIVPHVDVITATQTLPVLVTVDVTTEEVRPVSILAGDDTGS